MFSDYLSLLSKREIINVDDFITSFSPDELEQTIKQISPRYIALLEKFSFAKHALEICRQINRLNGLRNLIPFWIRLCVEAGAYEDCISFSEFNTNVNSYTANIHPREQLTILFSRAKAFRNIGLFKEAQHCYREIITIAESIGAHTDVSIGLLLIGKLYGNYLGQRSLFSSFVEEAKARLETQLKHYNGKETEYKRFVRGIAICHDALGQAYRYSDWHKVEDHFLTAIRLNEEIKRWNGVSRARCHLNHFRFKRTSDLGEQRRYLKEFKKGMNILMDQPPDEKGLGIRFVQYSSMIQTLEDIKEAREYLAIGKSFAKRYSDYKTLTLSAIVEAELFKFENPERALSVLKEGRLIAQSYNLPLSTGQKMIFDTA